MSETRSTSTGTRPIRNADARPSVWTLRRALPWPVANGASCAGAIHDGEVHGAHGVPLALAILGALDALFCGAARPRWRPGPWATALLYHACGPAQRSVGQPSDRWAGGVGGGGGAVLLHDEVGGVCGMRAA